MQGSSLLQFTTELLVLMRKYGVGQDDVFDALTFIETMGNIGAAYPKTAELPMNDEPPFVPSHEPIIPPLKSNGVATAKLNTTIEYSGKCPICKMGGMVNRGILSRHMKRKHGQSIKEYETKISAQTEKR